MYEYMYKYSLVRIVTNTTDGSGSHVLIGRLLNWVCTCRGIIVHCSFLAKSFLHAILVALYGYFYQSNDVDRQYILFANTSMLQIIYVNELCHFH